MAQFPRWQSLWQQPGQAPATIPRPSSRNAVDDFMGNGDDISRAHLLGLIGQAGHPL